MTLALLILIPILGAVVVALSPERQAKGLALFWMLAQLAVAVFAALRFNWSDAGAFQMQASWPFFPTLGITISLGVDSVALLLVLLTALLGPLCALGSFTAINTRQKTYYGWLLGLQAAMTGVFLARDLLVFYTCFEFTLLPMYVLISLYGSTNRKRAATRFFLYTFTGSIIALTGFAYLAFVSSQEHGGVWSFDIATIEATAQALPARVQGVVLLALLAGFAVKVPLFPVHTWLPLAHTEAPTAGSVLLAGVMLKLGTYGIYRFVIPFLPDAVAQWAPTIAIFAIIGIIYAGLICWVQRDVKKLVAYSSVSHLGFCVLGLVAANTVGLSGSVLYMLNHGLSTGALFFLVGMMYERYHTRSLDDVGGLAARMPVWAFFMVFFTLASVGLPGLNGFVSEFLTMLGAFQSGAFVTLGDAPGATAGTLGPAFAIVAAFGVVIAAIYLLYMVGKIVFGPLREPADHHAHPVLPTDLSLREIIVLTPLAALCLVIGFYPSPILHSLEAPTTHIAQLAQAAQDRRLATHDVALLESAGVHVAPARLDTSARPSAAAKGGE